MSRPTCEFDASSHTYRINGRPVPSVTQVMADVIPGWRAADWYLQRGRAVHACAAMIAQGLEFEHDERIAGQVAACRRFYAEVYGGLPKVDLVEHPVFSRRYQFAGTLDLLASFPERITLVDFKATLTEAVPIQLAAYGIALNESSIGVNVKWGLGVQLNEDGTYKCSEVYDLRRYKAEWLALLTTFNVRRRLKIKEETNEGN